MDYEVDKRFTYHPPESAEDSQNHEHVRSIVKHVAEEFVGLLPEGREKSLAITHLEEAVMWANAALARARA